jgi:nucleoside-diphosphate-sugar epimerase
VTGVTGFVGSHVARHLLSAGIDVAAVVRPTARLDRIPDLVGRISLHSDDGSVDTMRAIVATADPDVVFHLATNFVAEHRAEDVDFLVADNVAFPTRLLDALGDGNRVFVNVGTCWQHVDGAPYRPKNLYAATKQAFEDVLRWYVERGSVRAITVNLYDSYGPLDHRPKVLSALVAALRTGETLEMSSGVQLVDLVHVDDVVQGLRLAADLVAVAGDDAARVMPIHSLSSGRPCTLRELVEVLGDVAGRPVPVRWGARPDRVGDMTTFWDSGPPVPGWTPTIRLEIGLGELLDDAGMGRRAPTAP